jgi:hypothetical protein
MFIPSAQHLTWQPGPMSPALNPSPPSPDSEVAAPSLIIKRTSLTVIRALPPPPRSDIAPIGIIPCTPKTSKPRTKFHPTSPIVGLAECFALPVANVEVCRVPPAAYSRAVGALRRAILYRGRMVTRAASPCSKLIGSGSVQGTPTPNSSFEGQTDGYHVESANKRCSTACHASSGFTLHNMPHQLHRRGSLPLSARRVYAPGSTNGTTSAQGSRDPDVTHPPLVSAHVGSRAGPIFSPSPPKREAHGWQQENFMRRTSRRLLRAPARSPQNQSSLSNLNVTPRPTPRPRHDDL